MTDRTPIFSEEILARFRGTLTHALDSAEYWQGVSVVRLRALLATILSPEFACLAFSDELAAVKAWAHDAPEAIDRQAIFQVTSLFCQLTTDEQRRAEIPSADGFEALLAHLDDTVLPDRLTDVDDSQPLVLILRGLSGSGKSSLAEIMYRTGFKNQQHVGLLASDIYHCKIGRDVETKKSLYRTEDGGAIAVDPLFSEDPIGDAKSVLWSNEFRSDFERLAGKHRIIVVDGGYGELLLDELGILASQRLLIEVYTPSDQRFSRVSSRAERFHSAAAARVKIMNDMILSVGWYSVLMENSATSDWIVTPQHTEMVQQIVERRAQQLGHDPLPPNDRDRLLSQINIAREPGTPAVSADELDRYLSSLFHEQTELTPETLRTLKVTEIHSQLPADVQSHIAIPQLQRILDYHIAQLARQS